MTHKWQQYRVMLSRSEKNGEHLVVSHPQYMAGTGITLVAILKNLAVVCLPSAAYLLHRRVCFSWQGQVGMNIGVVMSHASNVYRLVFFIQPEGCDKNALETSRLCRLIGTYVWSKKKGCYLSKTRACKLMLLRSFRRAANVGFSACCTAIYYRGASKWWQSRVKKSRNERSCSKEKIN